MNKTRRGFLATLALLPGVAFFGRSRAKAKMLFESDVTIPAEDRDGDVLRPDRFKFSMGQIVNVLKDGRRGVIIGRSEHLEHWDGPGWAARRYYTCRMEHGDVAPLRFHYGENELDAPVLSGKCDFVMKINEVPIFRIDKWEITHTFAKKVT